MNFAYTYDNRGNITSETRNGVTTTYEYDALGQLTRVNDPNDPTGSTFGTTWIYTYDRGGNILNKSAYVYTTGTVGTVVRSWAYGYDDPNWKDKLTSFDGHTITYDAIGNPLNDGEWTYEWQAGRQLKRMTNLTTGVVMEFTYNHAGIRTKKVKKENGVAVETTEYILNGKQVVGLVHTDHTTSTIDELQFFYDAQGKQTMVEFDGVKYSYAYNLQGDVIGIVDSTGNVVVGYSYDAWGKPISTTASSTLTTELAGLNPFRYRGYVWDQETELYYLRSRYYTSLKNRFLNMDCCMINNATISSHNYFTYCKNRPVTRIDTTGQGDVYVFYYNREICKYPLKKEAYELIYYNFAATNVHFIEVGYSDDFCRKWNDLDDSNIDAIFLVLHGSAGRISFDEPNGDYVSFEEDGGSELFLNFQPKKVNGPIYVLSCHAAENKDGRNVAEYFAKLCETVSFGCKCGVSYSRFLSDKQYAVEEKRHFWRFWERNWMMFNYCNGRKDSYTLLGKWLTADYHDY